MGSIRKSMGSISDPPPPTSARIKMKNCVQKLGPISAQQRTNLIGLAAGAVKEATLPFYAASPVLLTALPIDGLSSERLE